MNYEEQILELRKRIEVLEKAENKRIAKRKREIFFEVGKFLLIIILLYVGYINYIKPIKDKIDYFDEKVNTIESFIDEKLDYLNKYNPFA